MRPAERSLAGRVALGTALSAGVVAILAASGSLFVADRLVREAEDGRLRAASLAFATEAPLSGDAAALGHAVRQEQDELAPTSLRLAVTQGAGRLGDANLPMPAAGTCASHDVGAETVRVCTVRRGPLLVGVGATRTRSGLATVLVPAVVAALIAALAAAVLGVRSARWALGPLTRLRSSLDGIDGAEPARVVLAEGDACREVEELRAALDGLLTRLGGALGAARSFSADAAHELRTPLTVIRGELELLAEEPLDEATSRSVSKLRAQVAGLLVLTERLLALATAGEREPGEGEAVALEEVVTDVVARLPSPLRARVQTRAPAQGMVRGDANLLAALVENAVENALKFSGEGTVEVDVREEEGRVVVEVADEGPGVPEGERERAFEPFFRSAAVRAQGAKGHGVGLALVARIANAHRGAVRFVDPEPGAVGARLRVELPAWAPVSSRGGRGGSPPG